MPRRGVIATAPSNIALMKYWGKIDDDRNRPANSSLSMTLSCCVSTTEVTAVDGSVDLLTLNDQQIDRDDPRHGRIFAHIERMRKICDLDTMVRVASNNSFPTACGIASSASGMAALTLGIAAFAHDCDDIPQLANKGWSRQKLAAWSQLGSGSSGRSFLGGYVEWQKQADEDKIVPLWGEDHWQLYDLIVVADPRAKGVTSSDGHRLAWESPLFTTRLAGLGERMDEMKQGIDQRDLTTIGRLMEAEALEMHAIVMTSGMGKGYLPPKTYEILQWLRDGRQRGHWNAYFTLDAGPTVHILCGEDDRGRLRSSLASDFGELRVIEDQTGRGPSLANIDAGREF